MNLMLAQFGTDWVSLVLWFVIAIVFFFFGQRIMVTQIILQLEKEVIELEEMAEKSRNYVLHSISKKPNENVKKSVKNFMEFFAIGPVSSDPYGIIKKIDHIVRNADDKFKYVVNQIAPDADIERQKDIRNALEGAMTTNQIAKIIRHNLELIKKYKMFQLAVILQMQIPLIARIAKASMKATQAFADRIPIGDGIGPYVAASFVTTNAKVYDKYEFMVAKTKIDGKEVWVSKAAGPGASTGYPGKFLLDFMKRQRLDRIITIDAALKLEGEKTGSIAEGVGVAMGGTGVDRYEIEEIVVKKNIPLDAVVVKVSEEDALEPMKKEVFNAAQNAAENVREILKRNKNERVMIIGVGNTCGIGNTKKDLDGVEKKIRDYAAKNKEEKKSFFRM
jgi:hypothetical protein